MEVSTFLWFLRFLFTKHSINQNQIQFNSRVCREKIPHSNHNGLCVNRAPLKRELWASKETGAEMTWIRAISKYALKRNHTKHVNFWTVCISVLSKSDHLVFVCGVHMCIIYWLHNVVQLNGSFLAYCHFYWLLIFISGTSRKSHSNILYLIISGINWYTWLIV